MVNILLINPPSNCVEDDHLEPQLGLLYIASLLRENKFAVQIYEMTGCNNKPLIENKIKNIPDADIYGITTYCTNYIFVKLCIEQIRSKERKSIVILGGPNPTAIPEFTSQDSKCDCVIIGEGEDAFLNAVKSYMKNGRIPSAIKGSGRINIDSYPLPAWDLVELDNYTRILDGKRVVSIISSRGCKYNCAHCNSVVMGGGNKVRFRSSKNILAEINYLKTKDFNKFRFNDDNFTGNPNLPNLLADLKDANISYRIFARIEDLTENNCLMLSESGCRHISIGLESLNPDNLKVLGKSTQIGLEEQHIANAKKFGIVVRSYFMVGLPYDTNCTITKYFKKANTLPFDEFSIYPLIPYPGTQIAKDPKKFGYNIINKDFWNYVQIGKNKSTTYALRHKNFTEHDTKRWLHYVEDLFHLKSKILQRDSKTAI